MNNLPQILTVRDIPGISTSPDYVDYKASDILSVEELRDRSNSLLLRGIVTEFRKPKPSHGRTVNSELAIVRLPDQSLPFTQANISLPPEIAAALKGGRIVALSTPSVQAQMNMEAIELHFHAISSQRAAEQVRFSLLDRLRNQFWFEKVSDAAIVTSDLPLFRLHCPKVEGCTASYESTKSIKKQVECGVKFSGLGFGESKEVTVSDLTSYEVSAQCMEIQVPADLEVTFGNLWLRDRLFMTGLRVDIKKVHDKEIKAAEVPKGKDLCDQDSSTRAKFEKEEGFVSGSFDFQKFGPKTLTAQTLNQVERETVQKAGVELPLTFAGLPFTVTLGSERALSEGVSVKCKLAGGRKYVWYCSGAMTENKSMECFWTIVSS